MTLDLDRDRVVLAAALALLGALLAVVVLAVSMPGFALLAVLPAGVGGCACRPPPIPVFPVVGAFVATSSLLALVVGPGGSV